MTPLQNARRQRRNMSPAEVRLWLVLRERPHGFKFRRQRPTDPFALDFFCKVAGLAIEVDGDAHDLKDALSRMKDETIASPSVTSRLCASRPRR